MVPMANDANTQVALFTTGKHVVPPGVPQYLSAGAIGMAKDAKLTGADWKLTAKPDGSKATLAASTADTKATGLPEGAQVFTPDVVGNYTITLSVKDSAGATSQPVEQVFVVSEYAGITPCQGCHADTFATYSKTGHADFFKRAVDTNLEGIYADRVFQCASCHTAGYYAGSTVSTKGWYDQFLIF